MTWAGGVANHADSGEANSPLIVSATALSNSDPTTVQSSSDGPVPPNAVQLPKTDSSTPYSAVRAFLTAVMARNPALLREAISHDAPTKARDENQSLFSAILEQRLSEKGLAELAAGFDGFRITTFVYQGKAPLWIVLMKPDPDGSQLVRRVFTRHEKAGWKVVDFEKPRKPESPLLIRPKRTR